MTDHRRAITATAGTSPVSADVPSPAWWRLDAEIYGHSPAETIAYASALMDDEDRQQRAGAGRMVLISPEVGPRPRRGLLGWLRGR